MNNARSYGVDKGEREEERKRERKKKMHRRRGETKKTGQPGRNLRVSFRLVLRNLKALCNTEYTVFTSYIGASDWSAFRRPIISSLKRAMYAV